MNKKQKIAMTIARIAALILLLLVIAYVFVRIKEIRVSNCREYSQANFTEQDNCNT